MMSHVLLIGKNNDLRKYINRTLVEANYTVLTASTTKKYAAKNPLEAPTMVIYCEVPKNTGQNKSETKCLESVPTIMITDPGFKSTEVSTSPGVLSKYLTAPFSNEELLCSINELCGYSKRNINGIVQHAVNDLAQPCRASLNKMLTLACNSSTQHFKRKATIFNEGNHPVQLFYIEKGKVKVIKTNHDGKSLTVALLKEGDFLGYTALLEGTTYKHSALTIEDSDLLCIPKDEFELLLRSDCEVACQFVQLLAKNSSEKEDQLLSMAYNSLRQRVAGALMTLQQKYCKTSQLPFSIHVSREDLAKIAGTATESLIRMLSRFKHERLIDIKKGNIIILDSAKLLKLLY